MRVFHFICRIYFHQFFAFALYLFMCCWCAFLLCIAQQGTCMQRIIGLPAFVCLSASSKLNSYKCILFRRSANTSNIHLFWVGNDDDSDDDDDDDMCVIVVLVNIFHSWVQHIWLKAHPHGTDWRRAILRKKETERGTKQWSLSSASSSFSIFLSSFHMII